MLLGALQKGSLDMTGAVVELAGGRAPGLDWVLRIENSSMLSPFEVMMDFISIFFNTYFYLKNS